MGQVQPPPYEEIEKFLKVDFGGLMPDTEQNPSAVHNIPKMLCLPTALIPVVLEWEWTPFLLLKELYPIFSSWTELETDILTWLRAA